MMLLVNLFLALTSLDDHAKNPLQKPHGSLSRDIYDLSVKICTKTSSNISACKE